MGKKKMKLLSPFKSREMVASSPWPWPTCASPKTLSFRAKNVDTFFKTMNCAYVDANHNNNNLDLEELIGIPDLYFTNSFECASFSSIYREEESVETFIRGLRSERLFFEPGETSSILEKAKMEEGFPFKESLVMAVDSRDPFEDFRRSMEEMVEAHELKDWEGLEDLLTCYLRVNGKSNHGYIVGAFVDLLVGLAFADHSAAVSSTYDHQDPSSSSITHSFTSPLSFSSITTSTSSPSLSLVEVDDENEKSLDNASSSDV